MIVPTKTWGVKKSFLLIFVFLIATNIAILLNIPVLRQILGFLFITILPGVLILRILKLNKVGYTEKFVLAVGLSGSFLMFFGWSLNELMPEFGYLIPLSTVSLLISFNIAFIVLAIIGYKINKEPIFTLKNPDLSRSEKVFLIVPLLFPALSIFGMHVMNIRDNNVILMLLLFSIPIYVVFVCFFNQKFPKRLYPVVIFSISISLLLMMALRTNHVMGADTHYEYQLFVQTLNNLHWRVLFYSSLDSCLSISLLPTIYQSILNGNPEFVFKILHPLLFSISPLAIYVIAKKYIGELYGFLASCFFMFQHNFLMTVSQARTNTAILFFALAMMVLFNDKIDPVKRRFLFILFMMTCVLSHYATAYIIFFIILGTFIGWEIVSMKYAGKKELTLSFVIIFFVFIYFWYAQITKYMFEVGIRFFENTFIALTSDAISDARSGSTDALLGEEIVQKGIPHQMEFILSWLIIAFIAIGVITLIIKYKAMSFSELGVKKPKFLKEKFEVGYFVIALVCCCLLASVVAVPFFSRGYSLDRTYFLGTVILSVFFVIGGIVLSELTLHRRAQKKQKGGKNNSQLWACLIILLVLMPYFFCVTGVMYQVFGIPRAITLNSEGNQYDTQYIYDLDSYGAKWLGDRKEDRRIVAVDGNRMYMLTSQGGIKEKETIKHGKTHDYILLGYYNIINRELQFGHSTYNLTEFSDVFVGKGKTYDNGGSEVYTRRGV